MAVTPVPGTNTEIVTAGVAVQVVPPGPGGGTITNPYTAPGPLYVDPVASAGTAAQGTTFALQPGQSWSVIPGQTTQTTCNSQSNSHEFSVVWWPPSS
jgi:hypothetical protein